MYVVVVVIIIIIRLLLDAGANASLGPSEGEPLAIGMWQGQEEPVLSTISVYDMLTNIVRMYVCVCSCQKE